MALLAADRNGITVPHGESTITLHCTAEARAKFSQMLVLLREAEDLQPDETAKTAFRASMQTIADKDGNTHTLSVMSPHHCRRHTRRSRRSARHRDAPRACT